ncbi:MAG: DUF2092 domain-containing protein [Acidobacteriota bacterium]|nr:DUF2092 domain-containing protein [Acidobacteriota bacterium]
MMKVIVGLISLAIVSWVPALSVEGEDAKSDAVGVLTRSDAALKAVKSASYRTVTTVTGVAENFVKPSKGEAVISGWANQLPEKMYVHVAVADGEDTLELTGGGNGDNYFVIDHSNKKGYEDMDPGVLGSLGRTLQAAIVAEFVHPSPMGDEINAESLEMLEEHEVGGELCHQIRVVYSGGRGQSIWSIAKSDDLPRQRTQIFSTPQGEGSLTYQLFDLAIDPEIDPSKFRMKLPEGYEQVDDFAP